MNKICSTLLVFLLFNVSLFSQDATKDFEITFPEFKIYNSLYHSINFVDSRADTTYMGIVQLGVFNKKAKVIPKVQFSAQLKNLIHSLTDNTAKNGELLFQLRQLTFAEITGTMSEKGYCYLRAVLYSKTDSRYQTISSIDTIFLVKSADVTNALLRNGSKIITDFIAFNLLKKAKDTLSYSFNNILKIDSLEKRRIFVYNTDKYADGLYYSYKSFMNQVPDKQITVVTAKDGSIADVKILNEKNKLVNAKLKDIYAIVYNGRLFIATEYGFYTLFKNNDDFYFTGKAKVTANAGEVIAASVFFGLLGGLIATNAEATFVMKIDHTNGGFVRITEVKDHSE